MDHIARHVTIAVENAIAFQKISELRKKFEEEKLYLEEEIRAEYRFDEIVGTSPAIREVLQQIQTAAPTDSTVLVQGETGTGKELVARAIHQVSGRHEGTFVKLNCSAIPAGLLENRSNSRGIHEGIGRLFLAGEYSGIAQRSGALRDSYIGQTAAHT
jgi:formate hydrogenlyase transcriptional activator